MSDYNNKLIFGKNKTENIVNVTVDNDIAYIYKKVDGELKTEVVENKFWLVAPKRLGPGSIRLKGNGFYKYVRGFTDFQEMRSKKYQVKGYTAMHSTQNHLMMYGRTYYKGMQYKDVTVLGTDIETTSFHPAKGEVILISNTLRTPNGTIRKIFDITEYSYEEEMIEAWCTWVREEADPDIICGHNFFGFDLPYLTHRNGGFLPIGRGQEPDVQFDSFQSRFRKDAQQQYEFYDCICPGREIIDTMFLAIKYDVGRNFVSYGLKPIIEQLGLEKEGRIKWDFDKHNPRNYQDWDNGLWDTFREYCEDDGDDAIALLDLMIPSFFYLCQSIPMPLQRIINKATGSQIDSFMIRAYLQHGKSLPKASEAGEFQGAISMGIPGVYDNVRKVDVASLYPSIMRQWKVYDPKKDPDKKFLEAVEYFTLERLKNKQLAKGGDKYYDDLQASQKIVINSMYGFMGTNGLLFNSPDNAAFVTRKGREILQMGVKWACGFELVKEVKHIKNKGKANEEIQYHWVPGPKTAEGRGYNLVNVDTDSFSVTNGVAPTKEEFEAEIEELNSIYPELISWEDDGVFDRVIVVKAKNYVLKSGDKVKYKGSSLTDQKKEPALRHFLEQAITLILNNDTDRLQSLYKSACNFAYFACDESIEKWCTKKTVTKAVLEPKRKQEQKLFDAIQGTNFQEGDKVWVYPAIDAEGEQILKLKANFDNDADIWHLVKRVWSTLDILNNILDIKEFEKYHNKTKRYLLEEMNCEQSA